MQTLDANGCVVQLTDEGGAVLTEYTGTAAVLFLPSEVRDHALTAVEGDAFDHAEGVVAFDVAPDHPCFRVGDGVLFDRRGERLIRYPLGREGTVYHVPAGVRQIGPHAFLGAVHLREIVVPEGVEAVDSRAFSECPELRCVRLPKSIRSCGHELLRGSHQCREIDLPQPHPFLSCEGSFLIDRQDSLLLACLPGRRDRQLTAPEDIRYVDDYAFDGCDALEKIHFHHGLRTLGRYAFYHCAGLRTVELPEGLRSIGSRAFSGCENMKSLYIPDSVTSIEYKAFNNCTRLTLVVNKGSYADRYCRQFGFPCRHRIQWPWEKND